MNESARRVGWLTGVAGAMLLAAYAGFRLPSQYSMTIYNVTLGDGAWRRGILGTVAAPFVQWTGNRYGAMALISFLALGLLLASMVVVTLRSRWSTQKVLLIVWLVSPAGGYLFHEVGYADQWVYVIFIGAFIFLLRDHVVVASLLLTVSVFVHEATLLTTLPVFVWLIVMRTRTFAMLVWAIPPAVAGVVVFLLPLMSEEQVSSTLARLKATLPFEVRDDAVALFGRSLGQTWDMEFFNPWDGALMALPVFISLLAVSIPLLMRMPTPAGVPRIHAWGVLLGTAATVSPLGLVFVGWDYDRWIFLSLSNFLIVSLVAFQAWTQEPSPAMLLVSIVPALLLCFVPLTYFDGYKPRTLTPAVFSRILYSPHTEFLGFPRDRL